MPPPSSRPFLDMVYHALDSPDDDYHALFVLCLLYAMSHNKGKRLAGWPWGRGKPLSGKTPFWWGRIPQRRPLAPSDLGALLWAKARGTGCSGDRWGGGAAEC